MRRASTTSPPHREELPDGGRAAGAPPHRELLPRVRGAAGARTQAHDDARLGHEARRVPQDLRPRAARSPCAARLGTLGNPSISEAQDLGGLSAGEADRFGARNPMRSSCTPRPLGRSVLLVRPAWALSSWCKSDREEVIPIEVNRNCGRATDRAKEAGSETAGRCTRTGSEATPSGASGQGTAKLR